MSYQAILFDVDGTLIDSLPLYLKIMSSILRKHHQSASVDQLKQTFSMSLSQAFQTLKIPPSEQNQFEVDYLQTKAQLKLKPQLFPGVQDLFKGLNKNLLLATGIVTAGGNQEVKTIIHYYNFISKAWVIVTADKIPYHKPAPDPLLYAVDQIGVSVNKALYIGDALVDMEAANHAKMDFGIAGWGADPKVHFTKYNYYFKQPQDILKLF